MSGAAASEPMAAARGSSRKRKLTPVGRSWLRGLHDPRMQMPEATITAIVYYDRAPTLAAVSAAYEQHIWPQYRFSSCAVDGYWVPVQGPMDRSYHFAEKAVADEAAIQAFANSVMCLPLDHTRPLWTITILRAKTGRSALVFRVHHVISDGLGLLFSYLPILDVDGGDVLSKIPLPSILLGKRPVRQQRPDNSIQRKSTCVAFCHMLSGCFKQARMFVRGVLSLLIMKPDAEIKMNPRLSQRKPFLSFSGRHVFTPMPPVPMSVVKGVREKHGCTVNDAIMAALAGAFRRYNAEDLQDPLMQQSDPIECKAFMLLALPRPVSAEDPSASLVNNILTPVLKLPIDEPLAAGRIRRTVDGCGDLKSKAYLTGISLTTKLITAVLPTQAMKAIASQSVSQCTCNVTCLPLTTVPLRLLGEQISEVQVLFINNIPQVSLMTYNGSVFWNIIADPALIPDPLALGRHFVEEMANMAK